MRSTGTEKLETLLIILSIVGIIVGFVGFIVLIGSAGASDQGADTATTLPSTITGIALLVSGAGLSKLARWIYNQLDD